MDQKNIRKYARSHCIMQDVKSVKACSSWITVVAIFPHVKILSVWENAETALRGQISLQEEDLAQISVMFAKLRHFATFCGSHHSPSLLTNSFVTIGREFEPSCSNSQKSGRFTKLGVLAEQQNRSHSAQHATFVCFPRILKTPLLFCNNSKYLKNNIDKY